MNKNLNVFKFYYIIIINSINIILCTYNTYLRPHKNQDIFIPYFCNPIKH